MRVSKKGIIDLVGHLRGQIDRRFAADKSLATRFPVVRPPAAAARAS
jgi:hypothetical protein